VRTPLRVLSGGERARLSLARALARPSNLIVLDEPTNDLDIETLDVIEEMLGDYRGTVILISHDRDFLDRVVNAVIVPEGNGKWQEYAGGYSDMLLQRGADVIAKQGAKLKSAPTIRPAAVASTPSAERRRLKFHEKHALETLPKEIESLKARIADLQSRLGDPELYARDAKSFAEISTSLADAQHKLAEAEEKWLELEILREEIERA
jgi:ATP-binding cassette subfamily F protein uup